MTRIILTEEEKGDLLGKHEEIDRKLMNFLLRRYSVEEKTIGEDDDAIKWVEVNFVDFPMYGFNTFMNRKDMEWRILNMLEDAEKLNADEFRYNRQLDKNKQKTIKTIRAFLNFVLPVK